MRNFVPFAVSSTFLLSIALVHEAGAQNQPASSTAMCPVENPGCASPDWELSPGTVVTYYDGPHARGEDPARYRSRRDFAVKFADFLELAGISPALAQEILRALYEYQEQQLPLLKSVRKEIADGSLCRGDRSADERSRYYYATLENRLQSMLTWEQWSDWQKLCYDCAYLVGGWYYDKPILKKQQKSR